MSVRSVSRGQGLVSVALMAAFVGGCTGSPPAKPGSGSAGSGGGNTGTAGSTGTAGNGGGTGGSTGTAGHGGGTGGSTGTAGHGAGGTAGSGATGTAGASGNGGSGAGGSSACANPQTSFGFIGQGDSNPNFWSGVGALGPNVMYIFSGFVGPQGGDAGAFSLEVYVQAFDPKTGVSKGASKPLFSPPLTGYGGTFMASGQVNVFSAAISPTGDIALVYELLSGGEALYVAFLSPSTSNDGGVYGLQLQHVALLTTQFYGGGVNNARVIWSNSSQTFMVSYKYGADLSSISKFAVGGQTAGGVGPVPTIQSDSEAGSLESAGESGNLLGVEYLGSEDWTGDIGLTILDENENLVGSPLILTTSNADRSLNWSAVAGTAQGFVVFYVQTGQQAVQEVFVSTSASAGIVGGDGGTGTLPGFTFTGKAFDARAISDNVGTGGKGGVGLALVLDGGPVAFAYVNADGVGHLGPYQAFAQGGGQGTMSMTNFNGSFAISNYDSATHSAQVIETGICP